MGESTERCGIIGDLNSLYDSPLVDALFDADLMHEFDVLQPEQRYTYIYQGISQTLDHILITQPLEDLLLSFGLFFSAFIDEYWGVARLAEFMQVLIMESYRSG